MSRCSKSVRSNYGHLVNDLVRLFFVGRLERPGQGMFGDMFSKRWDLFHHIQITVRGWASALVFDPFTQECNVRYS